MTDIKNTSTEVPTKYSAGNEFKERKYAKIFKLTLQGAVRAVPALYTHRPTTYVRIVPK